MSATEFYVVKLLFVRDRANFPTKGVAERVLKREVRSQICMHCVVECQSGSKCDDFINIGTI